MQFKVNGKAYTLGKTTLKQMIDDGVPFDSTELATNILEKNTVSQNFKIVLNDTLRAYVNVMNDSDSSKTIQDCAIHELYIPFGKDKNQNILTLPFSFDLTEDQLKANAGDATNYSTYGEGTDFVQHTYKYTKDSTKYYIPAKYQFEFSNGNLKYVTITHMP